MDAIHIENVSKVYRVGEVETHALSDVSLTMAEGEFTTLVGPSGSGKTTLLQLIGCLDKPDLGVVKIKGKDVTRLSANERADLRRQEIGFIFQFFALVPVLNAYENVELPLLLSNVKAAERRARVTELLNAVGLADRAYVAYFRGTTVTLFEKQSPDAPTNKPVCYDCHGIHDISKVNDPHSGLEMQDNLLVRCQVCHPGASNNFPSAWMSHYIPSAKNNPLVYYVNIFYLIFIPVVLGGMTIMVGLDVGHSVYVKARRGKRPIQPPSPESDSPAPDKAPIQPPQPEQNAEEVHHD